MVCPRSTDRGQAGKGDELNLQNCVRFGLIHLLQSCRHPVFQSMSLRTLIVGGFNKQTGFAKK